MSPLITGSYTGGPSISRPSRGGGQVAHGLDPLPLPDGSWSNPPCQVAHGPDPPPPPARWLMVHIPPPTPSPL